MKGKLLIIFKSHHGYVKRYVDILGNALGCDAVPLDKLRADMLGGYDKLLFISSVRSNTIHGFKKISDYLDGIYNKLIVCGIGMVPYSKELVDRLKDTTVSVAYEKFVPVFYAQGGFDFDELTRTEKMSFAMMLRQIKASSVLSADDTFIIKSASTPVDEVSKANIMPLIDYLEDKTVDAGLYSPIEVSDPEEQKKFFEELEQAAKAPDDKKRALKKKLKG